MQGAAETSDRWLAGASPRSSVGEGRYVGEVATTVRERGSGGGNAADGCHSGPEMPPSLRMRQKCTARKMAAANGNTMMWST